MATGVDPERVRKDYGLRGGDAAAVNAQFDACGFFRVAPDAAEAGDALLVRAGPGQLHLVILTDIGFLHADATLRRVVEAPGPVPWPALSAWRFPEDGQVEGRVH